MLPMMATLRSHVTKNFALQIQSYDICFVQSFLCLYCDTTTILMKMICLKWLLSNQTVFPKYGDPHGKDKTVVRPSYL